MKKAILCALAVMTQACSMSPAPLASEQEREMTLGVVQKEIHRGMSQGDVASALGSPNIVSKDQGGQETWIYDKVASEASYRQQTAGAGILGGVGGMAGSVLLLGIPSAHYEQASGANSLTQRTLTVVIKYDLQGRVDSFNYHSSRF